MKLEQFTLSPVEYSAELTSHTHQTLYWLNRNGYLDNEDTLHLLKHLIVVPIKNNPKFGQRILNRMFGKSASDDAWVFPLTMLEEKETVHETTDDKPTLTIVK